MKIRIEMTAEEINKTVETIENLFPGNDISSIMPKSKEQTEVKCNIYESNYVYDPQDGVVSEIEIKTHFIVWLIRKMKPFISAIMSMWHMFTDFVEDIELMIGDVVVLNNGEDLSEKLSKMTEDIDQHDANLEGGDSCENDNSCEVDNNCNYNVIYTVPIFGTSVEQIFNARREYFENEFDARTFVETDDAINSMYHNYYPLECSLDVIDTSKDHITNMLNSTHFNYRNHSIDKDKLDIYTIMYNGSVTNHTNGLLEALAIIDVAVNKVPKYCVYTNKHNHDRLFNDCKKAKEYVTSLESYSKDAKVKMAIFMAPAGFDVLDMTECIVHYNGCCISVKEDGSAVATINTNRTISCNSIPEIIQEIDSSRYW